jgi:hypothetical protein
MKTTYSVSTTVVKSITVEDDFQYVLDLPPVKQSKKRKRKKFFKDDVNFNYNRPSQWSK